jgi:hypothetical protein
MNARDNGRGGHAAGNARSAQSSIGSSDFGRAGCMSVTINRRRVPLTVGSVRRAAKLVA